MTVALSWPLQRALVAALLADAEVASLAADRIFDAPPHEDAVGRPAAPYVLLGEETVTPWPGADDGPDGGPDGAGATHLVTLSVVSGDAGFGPLKRLAAAVGAVALGLRDAPGCRVAVASFIDAAARQAPRGDLRRIDQRFRFLVAPA